MKNLRRIITGHNKNGKSIVMIDGKPSRTIGEDVGGLFEIWNTDGKEINSLSNKDLADIDIILSPIENGTKFRYFAIHPTPDGIPKEKLEAAAALAFEKIGILNSEKVVAEDSINHIDHRLSLPVVGRTDVHFTDFNVSERSDAASSQSFISSDAPFLSVCELKTSWQRPGKVKKDGTRSFASAKLPSTPLVNHLQQLAFYCFSLRKLNRISPYLIYLTADDHMVFTEKNCADLEIQNLNNYYEQLIRNCIRKERLLARYIDLEEPDMILAEIAKDVEPGFDHQFYWNIGSKHLARAKKIWSNT